MATMRDVASAAGVSIATVSATLSGSAFVSPELQDRVHAAVRDLGYARNSTASNLKRGRTSLLGLIISDVTNPFFTELVDLIQEPAHTAGYSILLGITNHDPAREKDLVRLMREQQVEGTILCPTGPAPGQGAETGSGGRMKVVAVDNAAPQLPWDTVTLDNQLAAATATRHLIGRGHREVALMSGEPHHFVSRERSAGFVSTMAAEGIEIGADRMVTGGFRIEEAYRACRSLIDAKRTPTAIFVANNLMLIGVMRALADAGFSVPADISVVSIDDFPWAAAFQPALTVVRQPVELMASAALDRLFARIAGDDSAPRRQVLAPELIVRGSCGPPRAGG